jgi:hypothetical protein
MREFASQKALISYAERKGLISLWEGTPAFARRQRLLSRDQYELAEVRTSRRGVRPAMLFPKAILEAEWPADAPFREAMAIKRERLRAKRAAKPAFNLEAALDGAHGCIFRSQIGLHLWGGQWGAL